MATPDHLGFLFDLLAARTNPHAAARPMHLTEIAAAGRQRGVMLPTWDDAACEELEHDSATDALIMLRTQLTDALAGEDDSAGREVLNGALEAWGARVMLEEELGPTELPGVEVTATGMPAVPLKPWFERRPEVPRDMSERCANTAHVVLAVASVLLTEATNIHLSGYAERVRPCDAYDCRTPFIDASDTGRRRFCSSRCRARASARARVRARPL